MNNRSIPLAAIAVWSCTGPTADFDSDAAVGDGAPRLDAVAIDSGGAAIDSGIADGGIVGCPRNVLDDDVLAASNADLAALRGVTHVQGDVDLSGPIASFASLSCLRVVTGSLYVRTSSTSELAGLEGLRQTLDGLEALREVPNINIIANPNLEHVEALHDLTSVDVRVYIADNPALETVEGLRGLVTIGDRLRILRNDRLTALGLHGLQQLYVAPDEPAPPVRRGGDDFEVIDNPSLPRCEATLLLERLRAYQFAGTSRIAGNDSTSPCP